MTLAIVQTVLALAAFVLPLLGARRLYVTVRNRYEETAGPWRRLDELRAETRDEDAIEKTLEYEYPPSSTARDVLYVRELIAYMIREVQFQGLKGDVAIIVVGLVAGLILDLSGIWWR